MTYKIILHTNRWHKTVCVREKSPDLRGPKKSFSKSIAQASDSYQVGLSDFGQQNILKVSRAIAQPELPAEVQAQNARIAMPTFSPGDAAAVAANDPTKAASLEALQQIARNTRGQR